MKDFEEFRAMLTQDVLDKWGEEVHQHILSKVGDPDEKDPVEWFNQYHHSFDLAVSIKLLEMYHKWLQE